MSTPTHPAANARIGPQRVDVVESRGILRTKVCHYGSSTSKPIHEFNPDLEEYAGHED
jgi:hypothetical protein